LCPGLVTFGNLGIWKFGNLDRRQCGDYKNYDN